MTVTRQIEEKVERGRDTEWWTYEELQGFIVDTALSLGVSLSDANRMGEYLAQDLY